MLGRGIPLVFFGTSSDVTGLLDTPYIPRRRFGIDFGASTSPQQLKYKLTHIEIVTCIVYHKSESESVCVNYLINATVMNKSSLCWARVLLPMWLTFTAWNVTAVDLITEWKPAVELVGTLEKTIGRGSGATRILHDFTWHQASDGRWHLTIYGITYAESVSVGIEGDAIYTLVEAPYVDDGRPGITAGVAPRASHISNGHYPYILWLAFRGGQELDPGTSGDLPSPIMGPGMPISYIYDGRIERHSEHDILLQHIEWHLVPERLSFNVLAELPHVPIVVGEDEANLLRDEIKWIRRQSWRAVDAIYRVLDVTEGEGIVYPARFEVLQMGWDKKQADGNGMRIEGRVTEIRTVPERQSMLPTIAQPFVSVIDVRFARKEGIMGSRGLRYKLPESQWITNISDPFLKDLESTSNHMVGRDVPRPEWHSWSVQIILILTFLIPLALFGWRLWCQRRSRESLSRQ